MDKEIWFKWFKIGVLKAYTDDIHRDNIEEKFNDIYFPAIKSEKSLLKVIEELEKEAE